MENKKISEKKKQMDNSYLKNRFSFSSQKNASDYKFIVPWSQYEKSDLRHVKNSIVYTNI